MFYKQMTTANRLPLLKIGLTTSLAILTVKLLNTMLVYNFFSFDKYLAIVAAAFFLAGCFPFLRSHFSLNFSSPSYSKPVLPGQEKRSQELKMMRYSLTNREFIIFKFLAEGKTNKEISSVLGIGLSTVKTHINHLFAKIKCKTRKEAIEKMARMVEDKLI